jgi:hypothetical protein
MDGGAIELCDAATSSSGDGRRRRPVKTVVAGWYDDVDRGGEVVASDRTGRDGRGFKGARRQQVG